jgi:FkbM family methyltransferase
MNFVKHIVLNKSASLLSEDSYLRLMKLLAFLLIPFRFDSPTRFEVEEVAFGILGKKRIIKVTFKSGKKFWLINPIRINRILKGLERAGDRLWSRYGLCAFTSPMDFDVFIDIGANVGELSLFVSRTAKLVVAVEPDPVARYCLERNLRERDNCIVLEYALGNFSGSSSLYIKTESADTTLLALRDDALAIAVECRRGDDIFPKYLSTGGNCLIKMDAEGFEPEVLTGMKESLKRLAAIAIDAGEERFGKSTVKECSSLLLDAEMKVHITKNMMVLGLRKTLFGN